MPSADTARLGDGRVWNDERLKLSESKIPFDATMDIFSNAFDAMMNSSNALENGSNATNEAHGFVQDEELLEPAAKVDEQGTPSNLETEEQPVDEPPF